MTKVSLRHTMNHRDLLRLFKSSHQRYSVKKGVLKNFQKLSPRQLCYRCFPVNFAKFRRTLSYRTPRVAASEFHKFYKKTPVLESPKDSKVTLALIFSVKFGKFLRTPILKNICERLLLFKKLAKSIIKRIITALYHCKLLPSSLTMVSLDLHLKIV